MRRFWKSALTAPTGRRKISVLGTVAAILITALGLYAGAVRSGNPAGAASQPPDVIQTSNGQAAVFALQSLAVQHVLATHNLPTSDTNAVLGWARDEVRADMFALLVQIIHESLQVRQAATGGVLPNGQDQLIYSWFQAVVQKQNIANAKAAENEFLRWSGHTSIKDTSDPQNFGPNQSFNGKPAVPTGFCNFTPPGPFSGDYNAKDNQTCFTPCTAIVNNCTPTYPLGSQFLQWGAYDAAIASSSDPSFAGVLGGTSAAFLMGSHETGTTFGQDVAQGGLQGDFLNSTLPGIVGDDTATIIDGVTTGAATITHIVLFTLEMLDLVEGIAAAIPVIGMVATAIEAAVTTAVAIYDLVENAKVSPELQDAVSTAQNNLPDLGKDLSAPGGTVALFSEFIQTTLPEALTSSCAGIVDGFGAQLCDNAPTPAAQGPTDPSYLVTPNGSTQATATRAIATLDPLGVWEHTYLSGNGWFVNQYCTGPHLQGCGPTFQSLSMSYTDQTGNHWMAERIRDSSGNPAFALTPLDSSNAGACNTKRADGTSVCITPTIQVKDDNNQSDTVSMVPASNLTPTATINVAALAGHLQATFTATASDPGHSALNYQWNFNFQQNCPNSSVCSPGSSDNSATTTWTATNPGQYTASLTVTDGLGYSTIYYQQFALSENTYTEVQASPAASVIGQTVTFNALVQHASVPGDVCINAITPSLTPAPVTGEVVFKLDDAPYGKPVPLRDPGHLGAGYCPVNGLNPTPFSNGFGVASISIPSRLIGSRSVDATFIGNDLYNPSGGGTSEAVAQASTTVTLTPSLPVVAPGLPVTLKAAVVPVAPGAGLPTGTVQFTNDGLPVGAPVALDVQGIATSPPITSLISDPNYIGANLGATYSGDTDFSGAMASANVQVGNLPTNTSVTSSVNPSDSNMPVVFSANVSAPSGIPVGAVQFNVDGAPLGGPETLDPTGTATSPPDTSLSQGAHTVTADYLGSGCGIPCHLAYLPSTGTLTPAQTVNAFGIATARLPVATPGVAYGPVTLQPAFVGTSTAPYATTVKWQRVSLPKGLKLSSAGVLSGTPNKKLTPGTSSVTVQATETVITLNGRMKVKTPTTVEETFPFYLIGPGANLAGANLAGWDLTGANLSNANLTNAVFAGTNLTNANLTSADAAQAIFPSTILTGANFTNANLTSAVFLGSLLTGANFSGATVTGDVWVSTVCPDGTFSDGPGGPTCLGHGI